MTPEALKAAMQEARRFIEVAKRVQTHKLGSYEHIVAGKEAAAAKRASMDLSRALSEMRKP